MLWLAAAVGLWLLIAWSDYDIAALEPNFADAPVVIAAIEDRSRYWETVDVSYVDPMTGIAERDTVDVYDMALFPDDDAATVRLELAPGTERAARLAGDVVTFQWDLSWLGIVIPAALWSAVRARHVIAIKRRVTSDEDVYVMTGEVRDVGRWRPAPHLGLSSLDATADQPPICSVRLIPGGELPMGRFTCEVKGAPRPFASVVVHADGGTLWPAGRALGWNRAGRPYQGRLPAPSSEPPSRLARMDVVLPGPAAGTPRRILIAATTIGMASLIGTAAYEWLLFVTLASAIVGSWLFSEARRTRSLRLLSEGVASARNGRVVGAFTLEDGVLWFGARRPLLRRQRARFVADGLVIVHGRREHMCPWEDFRLTDLGVAGWSVSTASPWWTPFTKGNAPTTLAIRLDEAIQLGLWRRRKVLMPTRWVGEMHEDAAILLIETLQRRVDLRSQLADPQGLALLVCSWAAGSRLQLAHDDDANPWPTELCVATRCRGPIPLPWQINHR